MNLRLAALFIVFAVRLSSASAQQTPGILPFEPAQMLGVLPSAPSDWKVLRSDADITLGEWLETRATRVFQAPPAPANAGAAAVADAPPGQIEISVVDTAGFTPALVAFANFTPAKNGNMEKKLIGTVPAIVIGNETERQFIELLVSSRYLVEITLTNLPRHRVDDWLRAFHFETLPQASRAPASGTREFRLTHLDEIQPKNNRSYMVSTTNARRVDAFLKTLPATPAEPATAEAAASK